MVLHFPRNLQRGDILVHRTIQDIGHCVQSYSLYCSADHRINIEEVTGTYYTERKSGVCTINFAHPAALSLSGNYRVEKSSYMKFTMPAFSHTLHTGKISQIKSGF
jgi:hypothetical protein